MQKWFNALFGIGGCLMVTYGVIGTMVTVGMALLRHCSYEESAAICFIVALFCLGTLALGILGWANEDALAQEERPPVATMHLNADKIPDYVSADLGVMCSRCNTTPQAVACVKFNGINMCSSCYADVRGAHDCL